MSILYEKDSIRSFLTKLHNYLFIIPSKEREFLVSRRISLSHSNTIKIELLISWFINFWLTKNLNNFLWCINSKYVLQIVNVINYKVKIIANIILEYLLPVNKKH